MVDTNELLFELGCEELPPNSLKFISDSFVELVHQQLQVNKISFGEICGYFTPRRLSIVIHGLAAFQPDIEIIKKGPPVKAMYTEDGGYSNAALGFAKKCGVEVAELKTIDTEKGERLVYSSIEKGRPIQELFPEIIRISLNKLPIAKRMRWGSSDIEFIRPVHWALLMYGVDCIDCNILGLKTNKLSKGHRFHYPETINIDKPEEYVSKLETVGKVKVDQKLRKQSIIENAVQLADKLKGKPVYTDELLDEINAINEWPVAIVGEFDEKYLSLPREVLITTMQKNQKYFPIEDGHGKLKPYFITFSNIESNKPEVIQEGNERVIKPRLDDAQFFWKQDLKVGLENRVPKLQKIIFQKDLGTVAEKSNRVSVLVEYIAKLIDGDVKLARRAATLAKADLLTEMVGEFANLQGIMGRYYALHEGEKEEVAIAIEEQYFPKQSGGITPQTKTGQILAIADKLDTLCGIFSVGLLPTGDKDPYALRRATLGILRIIIENDHDIDLNELVNRSLDQFSHQFDKDVTRQTILVFIYERLKGYCIDLGFTQEAYQAVHSCEITNPTDFVKRIQALKMFTQLPEAESLASANKRISNILKKTDWNKVNDLSNLVESQELSLLKAAEIAEESITPLNDKKKYQQSLQQLTELKPVIDDFFENVMVNVENEPLRQSRLSLLSKVASLLSSVADISKLH